MKNGVKFDDKHSIDDWDLLLVNKSIPEPEPKTNFIEIPGSNGKLDLTEAFGEVFFHDRLLKFDFDIFASSNEWPNIKKDISNYLHGKKMKIILDQDSKYYFLGRCKVSDFTNDYSVAHISIEAECNPYKYYLEETTLTFEITDAIKINCKNARKSVVPVIICTSPMEIKFEGNSYSLNAGTHKVLNIKFTEGDNEIEIVEGTGAITFVYHQADL